ncbi:MAG: response regulator [Bdellovibrionales bacterium]|nr:response regulator [Bdellovibrionales bacterium]
MTTNCKILVVDDDPEQLSFMKQFLERKGYQTLGASNGKESIDILSRTYVDLVVSDIRMPEMDGIGFVNYIKGLRYIPRDAVLPVILVTGESIELEHEAREAGADDFCSKEDIPDELEEKICRLCGE